MDGVQELVGVTIIAATNRPEAIVSQLRQDHPPDAFLPPYFQDSALMRPGRLDRILYVGPPDQAGREEILKIRMKTMTIDPYVNVPEIAALVCVYSIILCKFLWNAFFLRQKDVPALK